MKKIFTICAAFLLVLSVFSGCGKETAESESKKEATTELPAYTTEYVNGTLYVEVNDKEKATELVVPKTENGVFVGSCSSASACMYCDGFNNLPKIITAEDYENNIVPLVEDSDLSSRMKKKFLSAVYYVKKDITDPSLSTEYKKEILEELPITEFTAIYIFDMEVQSREVMELSHVLTEIGYDTDDCLADLKNIRKVAEDNGISLDITHPSELEVPNYFTSIVFSEGTRQINDVCPYEYRYVKSVNIPDSVENIDTDAFSGLTELTEIIYDSTMDDWKAVLTENDYFHDLYVAFDVTVKCTDGDVIIAGRTEE